MAEYADQEISATPTIEDSALHLSELLQDKYVGGFDDVSLVLNPGRDESADALVHLFVDRNEDDLLLLHISSQTLRDADGQLHFLFRDSRIDDAAGTAVPADWLARQIARCRCPSVIVLIDGPCLNDASSHVGAEITSPSTSHFPSFGRVLISAEYAISLPDALQPRSPDSSSLTGVVCRGISTGDADLDGDGEITVQDLYGYLKRELILCSPSQIPFLQTSSFDSGALVVARTIVASKALALISELPAEVIGRLKSARVSDRVRSVEDLADLISHGDNNDVSAARLALHELVNDPSRSVRVEAQRTLTPWAFPAKGGVLFDSTPRESYNFISPTYVYIRNSEVSLSQGGVNWVGGDQSSGDMNKQSAGGDMVGAAAGRKNVATGSQQGSQPLGDMEEFKLALSELSEQISLAQMDVKEKISALSSLSWWQEHIADEGEAPEAAGHVTALRKIGGWVWSAFKSLMAKIPVAGAADWLYEFARGEI